MLATQYLLEAFRGEGLTHVFLVPGGLLDPFLPALAGTQGLTPIVACHEGGAAYMADGYARASGRFGVCFAIGGPGVTNMVTAGATARCPRTGRAGAASRILAPRPSMMWRFSNP
jgi:acetolactate synthase-1/2/3 large subunit